MKKQIAVIGGDPRMITAKAYLSEEGFAVTAFGLGAEDTHPTCGEAIAHSACVVLPIPATEDGVRIRMPLREGGGMRFSALCELLHSKTLLLGGRLPEAWCVMAQEKGITVWDYNDSEFFQARNAVPTAEGAILLALQHLEMTLCDLSVGVLGYGRIASLLAEKLRFLGAKVTVLARREESLAHAEQRGFLIRRLCERELCRLRTQVVFNTVPACVVTESILKAWDRECLLIELASAPGGFDLNATQELGFRRIHAAALPGRLFPVTAGRILGRTVAEYLANDDLRKE